MDSVNITIALHHCHLFQIVIISFALKSCLLLHTFYQSDRHWLLSPMLPISACPLLFLLSFSCELTAQPLLALPIRRISTQHQYSTLCLCPGSPPLLEDLAAILVMLSIRESRSSLQLNRPSYLRLIWLVMSSAAPRNY
jgi:hypothetical protein